MTAMTPDGPMPAPTVGAARVAGAAGGTPAERDGAVLRPAGPGDAAGIAEVLLASRRALVADAPLARPPDDVRRWVREQLLPAGGTTLAEVDGTVVGFVCASVDRDGSGWIDQLYVAPGFTGRGVGERLLTAALAGLPGAVQLWTFASNVGARRFYERRGWRAVAHTDGRANEERRPDVRMRLAADSLAPAMRAAAVATGAPPAGPSAPTLRLFRRGDEDAVVALWRACDLVRPWNDPRADIERKLAASAGLFVVAEAGGGSGAVVGSVMAGYDGHRGWINYLAVDPARQRRGLGRRLMAEAEAMLAALGCPKVNLQVRETNTAVVDFYRALGWSVDPVTSLGKRLLGDG